MLYVAITWASHATDLSSLQRELIFSISASVTLDDDWEGSVTVVSLQVADMIAVVPVEVLVLGDIVNWGVAINVRLTQGKRFLPVLVA